MSRLLPIALAAVVAGGCLQAKWRNLRPDEAAREGHVAALGTLSFTPRLVQRTGRAPTTVFVGGTDGNVFALFTRDLRESWDHSKQLPLEHYEGAWLPMEGPFFLELPKTEALYLRGFLFVTDRGWDRIEVPVRVKLNPRDRVVYLGALHVVRGPGGKVVARDEQEALRAVLRESVAKPWTTQRWTTRLAEVP
jgi:hypothetical protein